jgi:hypothetical protein
MRSSRAKKKKKKKKKGPTTKESTKINKGGERTETSKNGERKTKKKKQKERTLLRNKRQTPRKRIHKVGQPIRRIVLPNRDILVRVFQDSTAVVVHV